MGIERTLKAVEKAQIVINMCEPTGSFEQVSLSDNQIEIRVVNKADTITEREVADALYISARQDIGIDLLRSALAGSIDTTNLYRGEAIVSNLRHFEALEAAYAALTAAADALENNISTELLAEDIRVAINHIGEITGGTISSDSVLHRIFSSFCIGK